MQTIVIHLVCFSIPCTPANSPYLSLSTGKHSTLYRIVDLYGYAMHGCFSPRDIYAYSNKKAFLVSRLDGWVDDDELIFTSLRCYERASTMRY